MTAPLDGARVEEGEVSDRERTLMHENVSVTSARRHYAEVLAMAKAAGKELTEHLRQHGVDLTARRLINAFTWTNVRLWLAAQQLCDVCELPNDGDGEGVVWELLV